MDSSPIECLDALVLSKMPPSAPNFVSQSSSTLFFLHNSTTALAPRLHDRVTVPQAYHLKM